MITTQKGLSNNNSEAVEPLIVDQTTAPVPIVVYSFPFLIMLFWVIIFGVFIINLLVSCFCNAPLHIKATRKVSAINKFIKNKEYGEALKLHNQLCRVYHQRYTDDYAVSIATSCFGCCQNNQSLFYKGLYYLEWKKLDEETFSALLQVLPFALREKFIQAFDVLCKEKNKKKEYRFVLNVERVMLL